MTADDAILLARSLGAQHTPTSWRGPQRLPAKPGTVTFTGAALLAFAQSVIAADRAQRQAEQEPIALIDEGSLRWHIPTPTYSVPLNFMRGQHWLYTTPQPAAQSARADFEAWFRENHHSRLDRKCANQTYNCPAAFAAWNTWEACAKLYAAPQPAVEPLTASLPLKEQPNDK